MRTLIYVPVIHTSADLGSLAGDVTKRGIADLGGEIWEEHQRTVEGFWDAISDYFDYIDVAGAKIYQDGMVAEGEIGEKIVEEGAKSGSKNYKLVARLLKRGAFLIKTEDFNLVKQERDKLLGIIRSKSIFSKLVAFLKYKLLRNRLLNKRDRFIVNRINETLNLNETGILFIGAYHNIKQRLPRDIKIKEIRETRKIKDYQSLLPFYHKNKKQFEDLSRYLISKIDEGDI